LIQHRLRKESALNFVSKAGGRSAGFIQSNVLRKDPLMRAENGKRVKVQFVGKLEDGTVFGESPATKPLEFTLGKEHLIPGFVEAVVGMEPGEKKTVQVQPEDGFGTYDPEKLIQFQRTQFAAREPIARGMKIEVKDTAGHEFVGHVNSVTDKAVTLDLNHPLAGQKLEFDIQLQEVA
jgi:peptidylprolyl isomerase